MNAPAPDTWTDRLAQLYSGAVHDVLRGMGHANCVLPSHLRPLDPTLKVAGPAWTVSGHIDHSISRRQRGKSSIVKLSQTPRGRDQSLAAPAGGTMSAMVDLSALTRTLGPSSSSA